MNRSLTFASAAILLVIVVMQLVYYVPYGTDYLQQLVLGCALAYVASRERDATRDGKAAVRTRRLWGWA